MKTHEILLSANQSQSGNYMPAKLTIFLDYSVLNSSPLPLTTAPNRVKLFPNYSALLLRHAMKDS